MSKYAGEHTEDLADKIINKVQNEMYNYVPNHIDTKYLIREIKRLDNLVQKYDDAANGIVHGV